MPRKEVTLSEVLDNLLTVAAPTLEQLAKEAGISYAAIRSWREPDGKTPREPSLDKLERALVARHRLELQLLKQARAARAANPERRPNRKRASP